jgi:MerR family redox-sensitive transcriptional activator SoxR
MVMASNGDGVTATTGSAAAVATMTIGELSEITGLSVSAIRFYQRRGLLPARDAESGWQRFGAEALDRLAVIELAKGAGFSLDEIVRLLDAMNADLDTVPDAEPIWRGLAQHKITEIDRSLARLEAMRRLLQDALDFAHLSADRAARVPAVLGWAARRGADVLPQDVRVPATTQDLHEAQAGRTCGTGPGQRIT